jgi:hypothetical protein
MILDDITSLSTKILLILAWPQQYQKNISFLKHEKWKEFLNLCLDV